MNKAVTLEDLVKKYLDKIPKINEPRTLDDYKHQNGIDNERSYSDAVGSLLASSKQKLSTFGANERKLSNKGLQNSGFASYIDSLAKNSFSSGLDKLGKKYAKDEAAIRSSYASYLDSYNDKKASIKKSVMSHLIDNGVTDKNTALAYGISAGLSADEANEISESVYSVTRKKVFDRVLEQTLSLGLDKEGAKMLALKMGISEGDADEFASEIDDIIKYHRDISKEYLEFLEQQSR